MPGIITRLLEEGLYENILCSILDYLDGPSLESLSCVSKAWNFFVRNVFLGSSSKQLQLQNGWLDGISLSECFVASSGIRSICVDAESILLGLIDGKAELWQRSGKKLQLESPKRMDSTPYNNSVTAVDLGVKYYVTGYSNGSVSLWSRYSGKLIGSSKSFYKSEVISVHILEDAFIYVAIMNGSVHKVLIGKNEDLVFDSGFHIFLGFKNIISDVSVSNDLILVGTSRAFLWKSSTGEKFGELVGGHDANSRITRVFLSSTHALTGSEDQTVVLWNLSTKKVLRILVHSSPIRFLTLNCEVIITGDDYSDMLVWDTVRAIYDDDVPLRVRKSSNVGGLLLRNLTGHSGCIVDACLTPTCLITSDSVGLTIERDVTHCLVEGPKLRIVRCPKGINAMACDDKHIVCGLLDKKIAVYDRLSLEHLMSLSGHSDHVWHIVMNSEYMVSGSWDASVIVWRKKTPRDWSLHFRINHPSMREVSGLCFVGDVIYTSSLCGSLLAFKLVPRASEYLFWGEAQTKNLGSIYSLTTDGKYLISGHVYHSTTVQLWDMDMTPIRSIEEIKATNIVWDIYLSYPLTLVCRDNEKLDICDLENRKTLKRLVHEFKVLNAVIRDGVIISGCLHGTLVFWDLDACLAAEEFEIHSRNSALLVLREHSAGIPNIYIDKDTLITDDYDGVVCVRKIPLYRSLKSVFPGRKASTPNSTTSEKGSDTPVPQPSS